MQATDLEHAIFEWISARHPELRRRLSYCQVAERTHTGAGFYVYLSPREGREWDRPPVDGPVIEAAQLEYGAGSILWLSGGEPHCLEIYAFGSQFPETIQQFSLKDGCTP